MSAVAEYMLEYADELSAKIESIFDPLHRRGDRSIELSPENRRPIGGQYDAICAMVKAMRAGQRTVNLIGEIGAGKAQPLDCKVLTPTGWKLMGEMKVGDQVVDPDGGVGLVEGVFPQGVKQIVEVTTSDGGKTRCCHEHLWLVRTPNERFRGTGGKVLSAGQMQGKCVLKRGKGGYALQSQFFLPLLNLGGEDKKLPLDPYLLGVLLGDGHFTNHTVSFTTFYPDILKLIELVLPSTATFRKRGRDPERANYGIVSKTKGQKNEVVRAIKSLGLMEKRAESKFIPHDYMFASWKQRVQLLQGLLDTDGFFYKSGIEYSTVSPQLAQGVRFLVWSIGGRASIAQRVPYFSYKGERKEGQLNYRINVSLPSTISPSRSSWKKKEWKPNSKYLPARSIRDIQDAGWAECQCIKVSTKRNLYVTDDCIVTHNTSVSTLAVHAHAACRPYRAIVMCPPHLVAKWSREISAIVPAATARIIERYRELIPLARSRVSPAGSEYYIVSESMAKLGTPWEPAVVESVTGSSLHCAVCHIQPRKRNEDCDDGYEFLTLEDLGKTKHDCAGCKSPLWQWTHELDRWPVATYIHKKMRGMFQYAILDEVHTACAASSAIACSASKLVKSVDHVLPLTGTYLNGYAHSIFHLLWRSSPATLKTLGFSYSQTTEFVRRYGRLEKTVRSKLGESNRTSRGSKGRTTVKVRPGIMPSLFGDHVLDKSVFLSLADVSDELPSMEKTVRSVAMDCEQAAEYRKLERAMAGAIKVAMEKKDMSLLSRLVHCLIGYPDFPYGWDSIGYQDEFGEWCDLVTPGNLSRTTIRPKERELIETVRAESRAGRQVWIFVEMTQKRDVQVRLESLLERVGLRVKVLRSQAVSTKKREEWIARNAPGCDVIISNARLVETGLDLFLRDGNGGYKYNFATLVWWQNSLSTSTTRQASGRAYRIGQSEPCKVIHMHYEACMEQRLVELMGAKIQASESIDGRFSSDGLCSLSDAGESMGLALAKSLLESMGQRQLQLRTAV